MTTATYGLRLRDVTSRGRSRLEWRHHRWRVGAEDQVEGGNADGTGGEVIGVPQGDVHRPVVATVLAELAGAVERIDDPHPVGVEAPRVLEAFLRQHGIVGPGIGELLGDEAVTGDVAGVHHLPCGRTGPCQLVAQLDQQMAGLDRRACAASWASVSARCSAGAHRRPLRRASRTSVRTSFSSAPCSTSRRLAPRVARQRHRRTHRCARARSPC